MPGMLEDEPLITDEVPPEEQQPQAQAQPAPDQTVMSLPPEEGAAGPPPPPPDGTALGGRLDDEPLLEAPPEQILAAPEPAPPGALQQATDALGNLISPITEALPEPVQNFTDIVGQPVGGVIEGAQNVGAELLQGDIPGAIGAGLATASGPYNRVIEQTGARIAAGKEAVPTPDEIAADPGNLGAVLGGLASRYGPAPAIYGTTEEDWFRNLSPADQAMYGQAGGAAMHQAWMDAIGSTDVPPPQLSNPFDAATSSNPAERAGQVVGALPQFAAGWLNSGKEGTLLPFAIGQAQSVFEDPTALLPEALTGRVAGAAGRAVKKIPGVNALTQLTPEEAARLQGEQVASATAEHLQSLQAGLTDTVPTPDEVIPQTPPPLTETAPRPATTANPVDPDQVTLHEVPTDNGVIYEAQRGGSRVAQAKTAEELAVDYPDLVDPTGSIDPITMDRMRQTVVDRRTLDRKIVIPESPRESVSPRSGATVPRPSLHPLTVPLTRQLEARGLGDYALQVVPKLSDILPPEELAALDGFEPAAMHDRTRKIITIALDHTNPQSYADLGLSGDEGLRIRTSALLDHEVVHALRGLDLFNPDEWSALVGAAQQQGIERLMRDTNGDLLTPYKGLAPEQFQEELVAHLYQAFREGQLLSDTPAVGLLSRLRTFLTGLGASLQNSYPKEVLERVSSGEIGGRTRGGTRLGVDEPAFSAVDYDTYHGSRTTGLDVLRAKMPLKDRQFPWGSATLGVHSTPDVQTAAGYVNPPMGPNARVRAYEKMGFSKAAAIQRTGAGEIYTLRQDLKNAADVNGRTIDTLYEDSPTARREAAKLRTQLIAEGKDGIVVWEGQPRVEADGTVLPENRKHIREVISFKDQPVSVERQYAARPDLPELEQMREVARRSPTLGEHGISERQPDFINRFRTLIAGLPDEGIVQALNQPFADPARPSLRQVAPNWDVESASRLTDAIEFGAEVSAEIHGTDIAEGRRKVMAAISKARQARPDALTPPSAEFYDKMLSQPLGNFGWYDVSGLAWDEIGMPAPRDVEDLIKLIAATSPNETPKTQTPLALALKSEQLRGGAGWVGVRATTDVERVFQGVTLGGNKVDNFARNLMQQSLRMRQVYPDLDAMPTIDVWQFRGYRIPENIGASSPELYAVLAHHVVSEADALTAAMGQYFNPVGGVKPVMEHRFMQAGEWVLIRANTTMDMPVEQMNVPGFAGEGTDYWSAMTEIRRELDRKVPELGLTTPAGTQRALQIHDLTHPAVSESMVGWGIKNFEESRHTLVEMASHNTSAGIQAAELLHNLRRIPVDTVVRVNGVDRNVWDAVLNGWSGQDGLGKIPQSTFTRLNDGGNSVFNRLIRSIIGDPRVAFSRVNPYSMGSWGSVLSPQVDIPLFVWKGRNVLELDDRAAEVFLTAVSHMFYQDGAAWNQWRLRGPAERGEGNSWILQAPGMHIEDAPPSGRKIRPESMASLQAVAGNLGSQWSTQVVSSPLATQVKLIRALGDDTAPISVDALHQAIEAAGLSHQDFDIIPALHNSLYHDADGELGYAQHFLPSADEPARAATGRSRPYRGESNVERWEAPRLVGGRMASTVWPGGSRDAFHAALGDGRDIIDADWRRTLRALPRATDIVNRGLAAGGNTWDTVPALQSRLAATDATGGASLNFPVVEELYEAVENRGLRYAAKAAYADADETFQQFASDAMAPDPHFYHGVHNSAAATTLLKQSADGQYVFRDGYKPTGLTHGELAEKTLGDVNMWAQGLDAQGNPLEWTQGSRKDAKEWQTLNARFNPNDTLDTSKLAYGSESPLAKTTSSDERLQLANHVLQDAIERSAPPAKRTALGGAFATYTNAIRQAMLFNVLNVPRYMMQNLTSNTVNIGVRGGGVKPALDVWTNLREMSRIYGNQKDNTPTTLNMLEQRTGQTRPNIQQTQRRYFDRLDPQDTPRILDIPMRLIAPDSVKFLASVPDQLAREEVGVHAVLDGYRKLNEGLVPQINEVLRTQPGMETFLPNQRRVQQVVGQFLDLHRTLSDADGKPSQTLLGKTARFEPTWHPEELKSYLKAHLYEGSSRTPDPGTLNRALNSLLVQHKDSVRGIWDTADATVDHALFSWRDTKGDALLGKATLFHYYSSRQGGFYVSEALKRPWIAAAYGRAMAEMNEENEKLGGPKWMSGFFQFANSVGGFTSFWSPFDWAHTIMTMADWENGEDFSRYTDLTELGKKFKMMPFFIHPAIQMVAYDLGLLGPDYGAPPLLGVETFVGKASDLLNLANAQDAPFMGIFNAMGIGVDEAGNKVPIPPRPLQDLYARAGHYISAALQPLTHLNPVEDSPSVGSLTRNVQTIGEQSVRMTHPDWDSHRVMSYVNDVLADPGNPEYGAWYASAASAPFQLSGGVPQPLAALGRLASPFQVTTIPEQRAIDTMEGFTPSGILPPRNLPADPDQRKAVGEEAKYGAAKTLEGRRLDQWDIDFDALLPQSLLDARYTASAISGSRLADGQITVGGYTYSNQELANMKSGVRSGVRAAYLQEQGYSEADLSQSYDTQSQFLADHPDYAQYKQWVKLAGQYEAAEGDAGVQRFVTETAQQNPGFAQYFQSQMINHETGEITWKAVFGADAYLAAQGIRPSVYSPMSGNEPSKTPGGYPGIPGVDPNQPILGKVSVIAETPVFRSPSDADMGYFDQPPLTIIDPSYGGPFQIIDPRTKANAGLPPEKQLVQIQAGDVIGFVSAVFLQTAPAPQPAPAPGFTTPGSVPGITPATTEETTLAA